MSQQFLCKSQYCAPPLSRQVGSHIVYLALGVVLCWSLQVLAQSALPGASALCAGAEPQSVLSCAQAAQERGQRVSDSVLRQAVEQAFQPTASGEQLEAAVRAFGLYQDRAWLPEVLQAFVVRQAAFILLNADGFARLHRGWTVSAVTRASARAPGGTLEVLPTLVQLDPAWAKELATTVATAYPAVVWPHAETLLAVDATWAEALLRQAASRHPYAAIRGVHLYNTFTWGPGLFTEVVLREARWVVSMLSAEDSLSQTVRQALESSPHPALRGLLQLAQSSYAEEIKGKMAAFAEALADHSLSVDEAARLSQDEEHYFQALVTTRLRYQEGQHYALDGALSATASLLVDTMNSLFEQPPSRRFRLIAPWTARELYYLLVYGEAEMYTSSYRGVFERLLSKMRQENLTGDQLLEQVHDLHFRAFIKATAVANQLERFLATMPAPVVRWSLLTRCLHNLEHTADATAQAMTVAEMLGTALPPDSLRLVRDTLKNEYVRTTFEQHRQGRALYGLLIAMLTQWHSSARLDPALQDIAARYLPYLPDLKEIPMAALFPDGLGVQRYFFYNDADGAQSFQSFMSHYRQAPFWQSEDHETFVHLQATSLTRRLEIYANKPALDEAGNTAIDQALQARHLIPGVIVHRGHSIYIDQTLEKLPSSAALIYLGNCGGYTLLQTVLSKSPQAHIFTTKGIGGISVNDPLLKALNDYLLSERAMTWARFWQHATTLLGNNPRFADYVPPHKNTGAFFLQAYRRLSVETAGRSTVSHLLDHQRRDTTGLSQCQPWPGPENTFPDMACTTKASHMLSSAATSCQVPNTPIASWSNP